MRSFQTLIGLSLVIGTTVAAGHALSRTSEQATSGAAGASSQASRGTLPKDIHPETGNRFPAIAGRVERSREKALRHEGSGGRLRTGSNTAL